MKNDLNRYIDRRFAESGKEREAYDRGYQEFLHEAISTGDVLIEQVEVDADTQKKMDAVGQQWRNTKQTRLSPAPTSTPDPSPESR